MTDLRRLAFCAVIALGFPHASAAVDLDALWDYGNPQLSERRFVAALDGASADERLVLQTQIARTHGMRRDFIKARELLAPVGQALTAASSEAQTRYWLELGRSHASAAHTPQEQTPAGREAARAHFLRAHAIAVKARLDGLAIDALHMMVFVDTEPDQQLAWNRKALALLEQSTQPAARRWEGSLRNNVGYALHLKGDYEAAIEQFGLSRAAYARDGRTRNVRIADWMIARTRRAQGRHDEALRMQLELERAWDDDGQSDPFVWRELEAIYRALGDEARAQKYAAKLQSASPGK